MGDEELTPIGSWSCIRHRQDPWPVMFEAGMEFIGEPVTWTAAPVSRRVSSLDHKIVDNPVKTEAVIKRAGSGGLHLTLCQGNKITEYKAQRDGAIGFWFDPVFIQKRTIFLIN